MKVRSGTHTLRFISGLWVWGDGRGGFYVPHHGMKRATDPRLPPGWRWPEKRGVLRIETALGGFCVMARVELIPADKPRYIPS